MKTITTDKMRNLINNRIRSLKNEKAYVLCEICKKYIPINNIQCHHSIITVNEVVKEFNKGYLTRNEAKRLLCRRDNIMMVCDKCHRKLHNQNS